MDEQQADLIILLLQQILKEIQKMNKNDSIRQMGRGSRT